MNYEQKYKDAIKAVKKLQEANPSDAGVQNWINKNFPELKESEDEKIKQSIIADIKSRLNNCTHTMDEYYRKQIAWLEKQCEQKSVDKGEYEHGYEACIKNAVEFLKSYRRDTYDGTGYIPGIVDDQTIEDFEKTLRLKKIDIGLSKSLKGPNPPIYL